MLARCLILAIGLMAAGAATPADANSGAAAEVLRLYTSKSGKYKVKFPQRAELTESVSEPEDGPKTYNLFAFVPSPKAVYAVMYFDVAKKPTSAKRAVNDMGEALRGKGKTISTEDLDLDDPEAVGKEWVVELSNAFFRYHVILKGTRAYHVALMAEDEDTVTGADADKFFASFTLLEDEAPKPKPKPKPKVVDDDDDVPPPPKPKPKPKTVPKDDDDKPY